MNAIMRVCISLTLLFANVAAVTGSFGRVSWTQDRTYAFTWPQSHAMWEPSHPPDQVIWVPYTPTPAVVASPDSPAHVPPPLAPIEPPSSPSQQQDLVPTPNAPLAQALYYPCTATTVARLPTWPTNVPGPTTIIPVNVPRLTTSTIRSIKTAALTKLGIDRDTSGIIDKYNSLITVDSKSAFVHPATVLSPSELALMQHKLKMNVEPQASAKTTLLGGKYPSPSCAKRYGNWTIPTDTPEVWQTHEMAVVACRYGGKDGPNATCSTTYPKDAPRDLCGHISFVELDAQMSYKQAIAYLATGNEAYARNAIDILYAWATTNVDMGWLKENGPLEAGWGVASMAKALEMLMPRGDNCIPWPGYSKHKPDVYEKFIGWVHKVVMPNWDYFLASQPPQGRSNAWSNWDTTIAEALMAVGILSDDVPMFERALALYNTTITYYLRWGLDPNQTDRIVGESTETLRDTYHAEFGLGGLLQVAEMAFQQGFDLYSSNEHVLAAAMEVHARLLNAGSNASLLPPGFEFASTMPKAPANTTWQFNIDSQLWNARNTANNQLVLELNNGVSYVLGNGAILPTGWEIGYNHFVGRLGLSLPESKQLLAKYSPQCYLFHWGLDTLTHADSASLLWRAGLTESALCPTTPPPKPVYQKPTLKPVPPAISTKAYGFTAKIPHIVHTWRSPTWG